MNRLPTGRVTRTGIATFELVLARIIDAPVDDVWGSVTDPARTALWFGPWRGTGRPGETVQVQMGFEEGAPWSDVRIDACDAPRRLVVTTMDDAGQWHLEVRLTPVDDGTRLELVHHLTDPALAVSAGPGWEYYLDMLVASRDGRPRPEFDEYYPAQVEHYEEQVRATG